MKVLVFYREQNMDSRSCLAVLESVYDKKNITPIPINYNYFIRPESREFDKVYVVGINLRGDNKLFLDGLCKEVFYFEQNEKSGALLPLLVHLNIKDIDPWRMELYRIIDAHQRGDASVHGDAIHIVNCGLRYLAEESNELENGTGKGTERSLDWNVFFSNMSEACGQIDMEAVAMVGQPIYKAEQAALKILSGRLVRAVQFKGKSCLIANHTTGDLFQFVPNVDEYSIHITYSRNKRGKVNVRLTTKDDTVDVRKIAEEYGNGSGGGPSPNIAGFTCDFLPEEILFQIHNKPHPLVKN